jgi:hypothetical protein
MRPPAPTAARCLLGSCLFRRAPRSSRPLDAGRAAAGRGRRDRRGRRGAVARRAQPRLRRRVSAGWPGFDAPPPRSSTAPASTRRRWRALGLTPPTTPPIVAPPPGAAGGARASSGVRVAGDVDLRVVLDVEGLGAEALRSWAPSAGSRRAARCASTCRPSLPRRRLPDRAGAFDLHWRLGPEGGTWSWAASGSLRGVRARPPDAPGHRPAARPRRRPGPGGGRGAGAGRRVPHLPRRRERRADPRPRDRGGARGRRVAGRRRGGETRPTLAWAERGLRGDQRRVLRPRLPHRHRPPGRRRQLALAAVARSCGGRLRPEGVVIDRVRTRTGVWIDDGWCWRSAHALADRIEVHAVPNGWAGSSRLGRAAARRRRRRHRQPRRSGAGAGRRSRRRLPARAAGPGPGRRRAGSGRRSSVEPASFAGVRYAVEAGPLLFQDGVDAFAPDSRPSRAACASSTTSPSRRRSR